MSISLDLKKTATEIINHKSSTDEYMGITYELINKNVENEEYSKEMLLEDMGVLKKSLNFNDDNRERFIESYKKYGLDSGIVLESVSGSITDRHYQYVIEALNDGVSKDISYIIMDLSENELDIFEDSLKTKNINDIMTVLGCGMPISKLKIFIDSEVNINQETVESYITLFNLDPSFKGFDDLLANTTQAENKLRCDEAINKIIMSDTGKIIDFVNSSEGMSELMKESIIKSISSDSTRGFIDEHSDDIAEDVWGEYHGKELINDVKLFLLESVDIRALESCDSLLSMEKPRTNRWLSYEKSLNNKIFKDVSDCFNVDYETVISLEPLVVAELYLAKEFRKDAPALRKIKLNDISGLDNSEGLSFMSLLMDDKSLSMKDIYDKVTDDDNIASVRKEILTVTGVFHKSIMVFDSLESITKDSSLSERIDGLDSAIESIKTHLGGMVSPSSVSMPKGMIVYNTLSEHAAGAMLDNLGSTISLMLNSDGSKYSDKIESYAKAAHSLSSLMYSSGNRLSFLYKSALENTGIKGLFNIYSLMDKTIKEYNKMIQCDENETSNISPSKAEYKNNMCMFRGLVSLMNKSTGYEINSEFSSCEEFSSYLISERDIIKSIFLNKEDFDTQRCVVDSPAFVDPSELANQLIENLVLYAEENDPKYLKTPVCHP